MESRSDSIKDPIYYPSMQEVASTEASGVSMTEAEGSERSRGSASSQDLGIEENNALKVPRKFITNWRQACDRTRDRTKDLLKRWRTVSSNVDEVIVGEPVPNKLEQPGWSVHVWSKLSRQFFQQKNNIKHACEIYRQTDRQTHVYRYRFYRW